MSSPVTGVIHDLERILLTPDQIHARVREMAVRLNAELAGKVVTVVALMDGALFFVADLLRQFEIPVRLIQQRVDCALEKCLAVVDGQPNAQPR